MKNFLTLVFGIALQGASAFGQVVSGPSAAPTTLSLSAGAVGTPSFTFGDATTGFYRPSANQIAWSTAGGFSGRFLQAEINLPSNANLTFGDAVNSIGTTDSGIKRRAATWIGPTDGAGGGGGGIEYKQVTAGGTVAADSARVYSKDVAGTAELFVKDEAGNETQISPHAGDSPGAEVDAGSSEAVAVVLHHRNDYLGTDEWIHLSAVAREVEKLSGKKFVFSKSGAPTAKWDEVQQLNKETREKEITEWKSRKKAAEKVLADFAKLKTEEKAAAGMPAPFAEPSPAAFTKKPVPEALRKRGLK